MAAGPRLQSPATWGAPLLSDAAARAAPGPLRPLGSEGGGRGQPAPVRSARCLVPQGQSRDGTRGGGGKAPGCAYMEPGAAAVGGGRR